MDEHDLPGHSSHRESHPSRETGYEPRAFRVLVDHERFEQAAEILETISDAFFAIDHSGTLVFANGPALELMRRTLARAVGATIWDALSHVAGPRFREQLEQALAKGQRCRFLERFEGAKETWYEVRAFPRKQGLILYLHDFTERAKAEEALREADRRKSEFLAVLSHELRNPLAPIRNSLYILNHAKAESEQAQRAKVVIERQVGQLSRLVDELLDLTRISRGRIELTRTRIDLKELVLRVTEDYRPLLEENGVSLNVALGGGPVVVSADSARITQLIGNLLHNATKFTPRGGQVTATVDRDPGARRAVVRITDSGIGMLAADGLAALSALHAARHHPGP